MAYMLLVATEDLPLLSPHFAPFAVTEPRENTTERHPATDARASFEGPSGRARDTPAVTRATVLLTRTKEISADIVDSTSAFERE